MKKTTLLILSLLLTVFMPCFALEGGKGSIDGETVWFATQEAGGSALSESQCPGDYNTVEYYLGGDANGDGVTDMGKQWFLVDNARYYGDESTDYRVAGQTVKNSSYQGSSVRYYVPESNMLKLYDGGSLSTNLAWYRASSVFPINQWVRALSSKPFLISVPSNKSNNTIQIAYKIRYAVFRGYNSGKTSSYVAMPVSGRRDNSGITTANLRWIKNNASSWDSGGPKWSNDYSKQGSSITTNSINWSSEYSHDYECMNIKLAWCGDGIVQNGSFDNGVTAGEECDGGDNCTSSCTRKAATCNSELDGKTKYDNTTDTSWVARSGISYCGIGEAKDYKWDKTTGKITWNCVNGDETKSCGATQTFCGDGNTQTGEECDGGDNCTSSCTRKAATCNSELDGKTKYDNTTDTSWVARSGKGYCGIGEAKDYKWDKTTGKITWNCVNGDETKSCRATQTFCGDGTTQDDEEECDGGNNCTENCTLIPDTPVIVTPKCNADFTGSLYNTNPSNALVSSSDNLCSAGEKEYFTGDNGEYTWKCKGTNETISCSAKEFWCGDGKVQTGTYDNGVTATEECDGGDGCNSSCKKETTPTTTIEAECNSDYIGEQYNEKHPTPILNKYMSLCASGNTMSNFELDTTTWTYAWNCNGTNAGTGCSAKEIWCGDGVKNGNESCDGADGAGEYGCSEKCEQKTPTPIPNITKEIIGPTTGYQNGDTITFKIVFKNDKDKKMENVVIKDYVPLNVEYKSSEIFGVNAKKSEYSLYNNEKIYDFNFNKGQKVIEYSGFNLNIGDSGYILLTGTVSNKSTDNRINVACAYVDTSINCTNGVEYQLGNKSISVEKKLLSNKKVVIGDEVKYKITVTNTEGTYSKLVIRDNLPKGLSFISGSEDIEGVNIDKKQRKTRDDGGETIIRVLLFPNGGFKKGESFDVNITAKVEGTDASYSNIAYICKEETDVDADCDEARSEDITVSDEGVLTIKKYVNRVEKEGDANWNDSSMKFNNGDTVYFKLVVNATKGKFKEFRIEDPLNESMEYGEQKLAVIEGLEPSNYSIKKRSGGTYPIWDIEMKGDNIYFEPGYNLIIIFSVKKISEGTNTAKVIYQDQTSEDNASISDPTPPEPSSYKCGDGIQNAGIEGCDWGGVSHIIENGKLEKYGNTFNEDYNGWECTKDCQLISGNIVPSCFNMQNGSISIMEGEMLPFYWNIEGVLGKKTREEKRAYLQENFFDGGQEGSCTEDDYNKAKIDLYSMQCHFTVYGPDIGGTVSKETNWKMNNKIYSFSIPCVKINGRGAGDENNTEYYEAIKDFINQNENGWFAGSVGYNGKDDEVKSQFKSLDNRTDYPSLFPVSSKVIITNFGRTNSQIIGREIESLESNNLPLQLFGEYKITLDGIDYKRCAWKGIDENENNVFSVSDEKQSLRQVCSMNFTVTNHYFVQKSPYGTIDTETKKSLEKYKQLNGSSLFEADKEVVKTGDYAMPLSVEGDYKTFITKYSKIAYPVERNNRLRKVIGKEIYIVDGTNEIKLPDDLSLNAPFTLIATSGANIRITKNIYVNMMLITDGKIIFDAKNACNPEKDAAGTVLYGHAGQLINGIFYAGSGFESDNEVYNIWDSTQNKPLNNIWCDYGNLHIKGAVIGKLNEVVANRRSELYTWFNAGGTEKRNTVLNGASVVLEYNPTLFGNMPPGAEEFNKLLRTERE